LFSVCKVYLISSLHFLVYCCVYLWIEFLIGSIPLHVVLKKQFNQPISFNWTISSKYTQGYYWQLKVYSCHSFKKMFCFVYTVFLSCRERFSFFFFHCWVWFSSLYLLYNQHKRGCWWSGSSDICCLASVRPWVQPPSTTTTTTTTTDKQNLWYLSSMTSLVFLVVVLVILSVLDF
jgi:hypothetical protein